MGPIFLVVAGCGNIWVPETRVQCVQGAGQRWPVRGAHVEGKTGTLGTGLTPTLMGISCGTS